MWDSCAIFFIYKNKKEMHLLCTSQCGEGKFITIEGKAYKTEHIINQGIKK